MTRTGVVAALEAEARTLRKLPDDFVVTVSGMGPERAYRAAKRLVDSGASALVSWGSAAALDATLAPGALIVPRTIADSARNVYPVSAEWHESVVYALHAARIHTGAIAETSSTLVTADDKTALARRTRSAAADMESAAVAKAARELGVPFIAIRAISDAADAAVPPRLANAVGANGEIDVARGVARLLVAPWHWPAAVRLGFSFRAALLALRVAAPALYASAAMHAEPFGAHETLLSLR